MNDIQKIRKLLKEIPEDIRADWDGTNHYEIQNMNGDDFWWINNIAWIFDEQSPCDTIEGQRLGKLLDFACLCRKIIPNLLKEEDQNE